MKLNFALRKAATDPARERSQITNPDIIGATTRIQGYVALCGFGMTRTRNQIVEAMPVMINEIFRRVLFLIRLICSRMLFTIFFKSDLFLKSNYLLLYSYCKSQDCTTSLVQVRHLISCDHVAVRKKLIPPCSAIMFISTGKIAVPGHKPRPYISILLHLHRIGN